VFGCKRVILLQYSNVLFCECERGLMVAVKGFFILFLLRASLILERRVKSLATGECPNLSATLADYLQRVCTSERFNDE